MKSYSLTHLGDGALMRDLRALVTQDRATTAELLAHLAEVEERRLYLPAGCASMFAYCVQELRMSEDTACVRLRVAREARKFPAIFAALADGRLHLTGVHRLVPHLTRENVDELIAAATHRSKAEIELLLAQRFPQADVPTLIRPLPVPAAAALPVPERVELSKEMRVLDENAELAPAPQLAPGLVGQPVQPPPAPRARVAPLAPERFALQVTINGRTHELLRRAQALLGHAMPSGDVAEVLERALVELVDRLEKRKFAKSARPRSPRRPAGRQRNAPEGRYVPAAIRRTVWQRDDGRCTFVGDNGKRCEERKSLEFDHVDPIARGGQTTAGNLRLRCRAHNQYAAERTYGAAFMRGKRDQSRERTALARSEASAPPTVDCGLSSSIPRLTPAPSC